MSMVWNNSSYLVAATFRLSIYRLISNRSAARLVVAIAMLWLGLSSQSAWATPPANDNFASAQVLSGVNVSVAGTNVSATAETGEPNPYFGNPAAKSVWYKWTAPATASFTISPDSSTFDTMMAVYTGSTLTGLTSQVVNRYTGVTLNATSGVTYSIQIDSYGTTTGTFQLNIAAVPPAAPPAPVLSGVTGIAFSGTAPSLPARATSLTFVVSNSSPYREITGLVGGSAFSIDGLFPNTTYDCYYKAIGLGGTTYGGTTSITTGPLQPTLSSVTSASVVATAPTLPTGVSWTLQRGSGTVTVPTPPTTNLGLWLKADSVAGSNPTTLSSWSDSSGSGKDAFQGLGAKRPLWLPNTINGKAAIRFDGANQFFNLPPGFSNFAGGLSAFIVARPTAAAYYARFMEFGNPEGQDRIVFYRQSTSNDLSYVVGGGGTSASSGLDTGQWQSINIAHRSNGDVQIYKNRSLFQASNFGLPKAIERSANAIGKSTSGDEALYQGDIAEILLYNTELSEPQRSAVDDYLVAKYGTTTSTPPAAITWTNVATSQVTGSTFTDSGRSSAVTYWYRYVATGVTGMATTVTTASAAPGLPTFNSIASSSLNVVAPALPSGAGSLTLQFKKTSDPTFGSDIKNVGGASTTPVYGLLASTAYQFRFIAVGANESVPGTAASVTTTAAPAGVPGAPTFLDVTNNLVDGTPRVTVRAPALPSGAVKMILQAKSDTEVDGAFSVVTDVPSGVVADSLLSNAVTVVNKVNGHYLNASTRYVFRYVAVTSAGVQTPGLPGDVTIPEGEVTGVPGVPTFSDLTSLGVTVTAPTLPVGATSFNLQVRAQNSATYTEITGLGGGSATPVTYPTGQRNHYFRFVAVSTQGNLYGGERAPTSMPEAPVLVAGSITAQTATFNAPVQTGTSWSELGETVFVLQRKKAAEPDSAYVDWISGTFGTNTTLVASQLAPGTAYTFRWSISGAGGTANGPGTNSTTASGTQPDAPLAPTFSAVGPNSLKVTAPSTALATLRADKLKLQQGSGTSWTDVADNLSPGALTTVSSLSPLTNYTFRYLAIKNGPPVLTTTGAQATVSTTTSDPEIPGVPSYVSATSTSITVTLPAIALPLQTASLTLQYKLSEGTADFVDWGAGHVAGGTSQTVTGLAAGRSYQMRTKAHAVVAGAADTFGGVLGTGTAAPAPGAAGAVQSVTIIDPFTVDVKAPAAAMPANADYLKLQIYPVNQGVPDWINIVDSDGLDLAIQPNDVTEISGLTPGLYYRFRYGAVGTGGTTYGPISSDYLMPTTSVTWASSAVGTRAQTIQCKGIRYPVPNAGAVTVARGASLRLSSYLGTDWDKRTITAAGTPYSVSYYLSDPCVYYWNAKDSGGNPIYTFENGVNRTQNAVWIAPSTPGTYTITLTVSDQEGLNKPTGEAGTRDDDNRGTWDAPLTFQLTVNVP